MNEPVDLLLISRNRREYLRRTLERLLSLSSDFRLYCWDNGSSDGSAELIADLSDPRVERRHYSRHNRGQRIPFLWFLENSSGDLLGKVDDDILLPRAMIGTIAPALREEPRFGILGAWTFMAEDWDERIAAPKIIRVGERRIFRTLRLGGTALLTRREYALRYLKSATHHYGLPLDQYLMTRDGLINGYPLPLLLAHHLDDPRSPYHLADLGEYASRTARRKSFESPAAYARWIAADARRMLTEPLAGQLRRYRLIRDKSARGSLKRLLVKIFRPSAYWPL